MVNQIACEDPEQWDRCFLADLHSNKILIQAPDGPQLVVALRFSKRAKRMSLQIETAGNNAVLVVPDEVPVGEAERFACHHAGWLARNLACRPGPVAFEPGAEIPILGVPHRIQHCPEGRGGVWVDSKNNSDVISVSGAPNHLARRVTDWLRRRARDEITPRARTHAHRLNRAAARISIRDTTSRWGSCSSRGILSFSWRLVLAPERVLNYVCAHEAAHLVEMNHSPVFWRLVEELVGDWQEPRTWLRLNGAKLHRYG